METYLEIFLEGELLRAFILTVHLTNKNNRQLVLLLNYLSWRFKFETMLNEVLI